MLFCPFHPLFSPTETSDDSSEKPNSLCFHIIILPLTILLVFPKDHQTGNEMYQGSDFF